MSQGYWYRLAEPNIGEEEIAAATEVLRSGHTTCGEKVEEFEEAFARFVGAEHAVMVNSGSSADLLIAFAMSREGQEILVPAVTWPTHVWSWKMAGAFPWLVDVSGVNTTVWNLRQALTRETVGISLVHLMGVPCDMEAIVEFAEREGLWITEDCCEALGAEFGGIHVGNFGFAAAWSFFFSHHMTTMEGGMVTTPSGRFAEQLRTLRSHGWARGMTNPPPGSDPRYTFVDWGFNLRPTEVAAAIGLEQLKKLPDMNAARTRNYERFAKALATNTRIDLPVVPPKGKPSWFGLPLFALERDRLAQFLEDRGVETRPILGGNLANHPAFQKHGVRAAPGLARLDGANRVHHDGLYVGLHPIEDDRVEKVAELIMEGTCS